MRNASQREGQPPTKSVSPIPPADVKRRRFLLALGAGTAASAAAATQAIAAPAAASGAPASTSKSGYRETEHVRDYYASTRI